jgi:hypothetical protein
MVAEVRMRTRELFNAEKFHDEKALVVYMHSVIQPEALWRSEQGG